MNVKIFNSASEIGKETAKIIVDIIKENDSAVLGLATGSSPIPTYNELISAYKSGEISFKNVKSFNLDEYCGIPVSDKNSYYAFMHDNLFNHIDIKEDNIRVPNGNPVDVEVYCNSYDNEIRVAGGIDIQILGIGRNGHIGFNEPADNFTKGTYKVKLTESTIEANKRFFEKVEDVPTEAITMGVESILDAKEIVLIATGKDKAQAIHDMVKGDVSPSCPASILQKHSNVHVFIDADAASLL